MNLFTEIEQKYSSMSRTFRLIADYVMANYKMISFLSVQKLSMEIGVSTASIVRFCQEIGYAGYVDFQRDAQILVHGETPPMLEFRSAVSDIEEDPLKEMFRLNIEILKKTYTEILAKEFKKAVDAIHEAKKVYIIGMRSTYTVAYYTSYMLSQFMNNIELVTAGSYDIFDRLSYAELGDVAIVCSFSKYSRLSVEALEFLRENGILIVGITDSLSSPIATRSDIMLLSKTSSKSYSFVSAMTVANALAVAVGKKDKEQTLQIMKKKEVTNFKHNVYFNKSVSP